MCVDVLHSIQCMCKLSMHMYILSLSLPHSHTHMHHTSGKILRKLQTLIWLLYTYAHNIPRINMHMFFPLHVRKSKRVYISRPIILEMTWYTYRHLDIDLCLSLNQYSHHIIDFALSCDVKSSYTILRRQKQLIAIYIIVQLHVHLE